MLKPDFVK